MRVLTFGWEFPPHISGGLGTACFGLTDAVMNSNTEVLFVLPKLFGNEDRNRFHFINASEIKINPENHSFAKIVENLIHTGEWPLRPFIKPGNATHFSFSGGYTKDLMVEVGQYAAIGAEIAATNAYDLIHAHDWVTYPAGIVAKKVSGKPLVAHVHATEYDRCGEHVNPAIFKIEKEGVSEADAIIAVSGLTKQTLIKKYGVNPGKITVVHNGVLPGKKVTERKAIRKHQHKIVTFLGRITFQKGPEYFVRAARKVLDKFPDVRFVMAGNGDLLPKMTKLVAELRMGSRFHFTGFLKGEETDKMFAMSDVYVMPSVSEPFGITPLEAMRAGVPVIISKQSGVAEVVKNALKVDFWNVDALADAIHGLLQYNTLSGLFITHGSGEVDNLSWDAAAVKVKNIYQSVLNK